MEECGELLQGLDGVLIVLQLEVQRLPQLPPQHRLTLTLHALSFRHFFKIQSSKKLGKNVNLTRLEKDNKKSGNVSWC